MNNENLAPFLNTVRLENLTAQIKGKSFGFMAMAEAEEIGNQIIDKNIGEILQNHGEALIDLHITDQKVYNK